MFGDKMKLVLMEACPKGEKHLYTFYGMNPPSGWVAFLTMGPLYGFFMKFYWVGVSDKSIYFLRLNMMGKPAQTDVFKLSEIQSFKVTRSILENAVVFGLPNGRNLRLNVSKMRKLDSEEAFNYIQKQTA